MAEIGIACCQVALAVGDVAGNLARAEAAVREAAAAGAQLVVLPELLPSGYCLPDVKAATAVAEPASSGPTATLLSRLATELGLVIVAGVCEDAGDVLHNSAVLVDGEGVRAVYRKAHLWDAEPDLFVPGDEPPPVVDTTLGRVGVMICYDLEFPEWVRLAALAGADVLAVPANWPRGGVWADGERPAEQVKALAAAATNALVVAVCDRAGAEPRPSRLRGDAPGAGDDVEWLGGSLVADTSGMPLALSSAGAPGARSVAATVLARVDPALARDKRVGERNDVLADRRPHLYGPLLSCSPPGPSGGRA